MDKLMVTNNPLAAESSGHPAIILIYSPDYGYIDVLTAARDKIHQGHKLLTHPLSGSVKPGETPYKTILLSKKPGALDLEGLSILEESILTAKKFMQDHPLRAWNESIRKDFQLIDWDLIREAMDR